MTLAVDMRGICKRFGAVQANRDVALQVAAGTVHGIVGENGAGKSTLMSILYGFYQADSGTIAIAGQPARITGSREAMALGIGMVHQHFMLVDRLSALDNVMLGAEPDWRLAPARAQVRAELEALMADTGLQVRLDLAVEDLPVGECQRLEILKALYRGAKILILDEPTAVLTPQETQALFVTLKRLRDAGTTLLLITHKLKEIMALCDHVTVMRQGAVVLDCPIVATSLDGLAEAMVGRQVHLGRQPEAGGPDTREARSTAPLLQAEGLRWVDALGVPRLDGVSLALRPGEIVGIAGVSGNGQSELLEVLAGMHAPEAGRLQLGERVFEARRWLDPVTARALHLAHVPEDRHRLGLVLPFAAWESAVLGHERRPRYAGAWGWLKRRVMREDTEQMMDAYDVRPRNAQLKSSKFSGGNQQKLVLAREALAAEGPPQVLLVSSELDEILALADRVLVMDRGRIAGELPIAQCTETALGRLMAGASAHESTREPTQEPAQQGAVA